ncbi:MAG: sugar ABC transporter permease [Anaerolineaceae bacterium]|jgi:arabinogalactan oligomer/maltooligosaccharide transport system permease protein|nr:MAG: sugar ABC transporter permease [Anaerolineaceae bacterium]
MKASAKSQNSKKQLYPYFYLLPGLLAILFSVVIPGLMTIYYSFTNYSLRHLQDWGLIGFDNFTRIFVGSNRGEFLGVFSWNMQWALISTVGSAFVGLILALLLNNKRVVERNLYRVLLILPWALPSTITILTWKGLFNSSFGPINRILGSIGIAAIPWLSNSTWARVTCLLVNIWIGYPFMMSAFLGGLQSIPEDLYDACRVDGANGWQTFWHLTLPMLRSIVLPLLVSGFAMNFGNFGVIYLLTEGGPFKSPSALAGATDLLSTYMYKVAFGATNFDYGLASANGLLIFLIVGGLTLINLSMTGAFREVKE